MSSSSSSTSPSTPSTCLIRIKRKRSEVPLEALVIESNRKSKRVRLSSLSSSFASLSTNESKADKKIDPKLSKSSPKASRSKKRRVIFRRVRTVTTAPKWDKSGQRIPTKQPTNVRTQISATARAEELRKVRKGQRASDLNKLRGVKSSLNQKSENENKPPDKGQVVDVPSSSTKQAPGTGERVVFAPPNSRSKSSSKPKPRLQGRSLRKSSLREKAMTNILASAESKPLTTQPSAAPAYKSKNLTKEEGPVDYAIWEAFNAPLKSSDNSNSLTSLAESHNAFDVLSRLFVSGADINFQRRAADFTTALMAAAFRGRFDFADSFLALGANPCLVDSSGRTASSIATEYGHEKIAALLLTAEKSWRMRENEDKFVYDIYEVEVPTGKKWNGNVSAIVHSPREKVTNMDTIENAPVLSVMSLQRLQEGNERRNSFCLENGKSIELETNFDWVQAIEGREGSDLQTAFDFFDSGEDSEDEMAADEANPDSNDEDHFTNDYPDESSDGDGMGASSSGDDSGYRMFRHRRTAYEGAGGLYGASESFDLGEQDSQEYDNDW
eukprot:g163.t1